MPASRKRRIESDITGMNKIALTTNDVVPPINFAKQKFTMKANKYPNQNSDLVARPTKSKYLRQKFAIAVIGPTIGRFCGF